jgi:beta-glucosidase
MKTNAIRRSAIVSLALSLSAFHPLAQEVSPTRLISDTPLYKNAKAPLEQRLDDLFSRLTQDEKLRLLGGAGFPTHAIPRLGLPEMAMADASQGVRGAGGASLAGPATAFPSGVLMASTWDTNLLGRIGQAIGEEARNKGTGAQILLGPAVNIHRSPLGGRNAEYFTEDPYLAGQMAVAYIHGMQGSGVSACIKHFACNNQEQDRDSVSAIVSERALREVYLPAFEAAVKEGGVWAVMTSYNKVNGLHSSANPYLLIDVLKKDWGFDGVVMSDWGGVHETAVVQAGNDLEMPRGENMSVPKLKAALANGSVTQAAVDDSVRRILRTVLRVGLLDGPMKTDARRVNSPAHRQIALETAEKGIVLLKNEQAILPLDRARIKSIALIGETAKKLQIGPLGSPEVRPLRTSELLDAIKDEAGNAITIRFAPAGFKGEPLPASRITPADGSSAHGFQAEYFKNRDLTGQPALVRVDEAINLQGPKAPAPGFPLSDFSVRWKGKVTVPTSGKYIASFTGDDGFRVYLDEKILLDHWTEASATTLDANAQLEAGKVYNLRIEYFQAGGDYTANFALLVPTTTPYSQAAKAARESDVAVVCISTRRMEGEGHDRPSMDLPDDQAALIRAIAAANKNTIVVMNNGTPVTMADWLETAPAVIEAWLPGQEGGAAVAAILFGKVNPSGKLPDTLALRRADYPDTDNFPGHDHQVNYAEGIYVGYRHFDKAAIQPLFPFGYGLSYTKFGYKNLKLSRADLQPNGTLTASVDITNEGKRAGAEVAQLYVRDLNPKTDKPVRELKGFSRIELQPGETKTVSFIIQPRELAYFDVPGQQWKADAGEYDIEVGASSRDIRQKASLQLSATFTEKVLHSKPDGKR